MLVLAALPQPVGQTRTKAGKATPRPRVPQQVPKAVHHSVLVRTKPLHIGVCKHTASRMLHHTGRTLPSPGCRPAFRKLRTKAKG